MGAENRNGTYAQSDISVPELGRGVLQFWVQTAESDAAAQDVDGPDERPGWELYASLPGDVMPLPPAIIKQIESDGIPRIMFMPEDPWTDRPFDNSHPRPIELNEQKLPHPDRGKVLTQWVLRAMLDTPEAT